MVTHVSRCIWTGLLHDASGFYEFMEEVVTAKSVRGKVTVIEVRAFYGAMGMVVMGRRGFVRTFLDLHRNH